MSFAIVLAFVAFSIPPPKKVLALYAKGMSTCDIQETLKQLYEVETAWSLRSSYAGRLVIPRQWRAKRESLVKLFEYPD